MKRVVVSWSSGKDCAWTIMVLKQIAEVDIVGLLTTFDEATDLVGMHGVRREMVELQAAALGLPLQAVPIPWPCSNSEYESRMRHALEQLRTDRVTHIAFGDLFLQDVREYRERQLHGSGIEPLFPLWGPESATRSLAERMQSSGVRAVVTCVDPKPTPAALVGREWNLANLPESVDPCGERGEFHTFCYAGPMFTHPIPIHVGNTETRGGFVFADILKGAT
jgi:uncharacterized protein (TIGR00290 family)